MAKKSNWELLSKRPKNEDSKYRNVHEDQQLKRSDVDKVKSRWPRTIAALSIALSAGGIAYWIICTLSGCYWYVKALGQFGAEVARSHNWYTYKPGSMNLLAAFFTFVLVLALVQTRLMLQLRAQNIMADVTDINQHTGDGHIALVEEVHRHYDWVPDAGAHTSVQPNTLLSHSMLSNKGIKHISMTRIHKKDVLDEHGDVEFYKGEAVLNTEDCPLTDRRPLFDTGFARALFDVSGALDDKAIRKSYDARLIPYNPGNKDRDKLKGYETVADLINGDWYFPDYEVQRPAGAYLVDTAPVNTMLLAITRAGKGQTYIEAMLDVWSRVKRLQNKVINDPKGELLKKNYVVDVKRGYHVVQFNLINAMKTDIFNPLTVAAEAAREGDYAKCAMYVKNIATVFFPLDGAEDPVWPNAARNAFLRAAYGMIDYCLEEEKELRIQADISNMDAKLLNTKVDTLWGKCSLYNCYQLFVVLSSKKIPNPVAVMQRQVKAMKAQEAPAVAILQMEQEIAKVHAKEGYLWEDKPEIDALTLFFNATGALPRSPMRDLAIDADNALKSMAGAEKMLASVYGIAITAMSFFTDPTISTLTSGTPSQNIDLSTLAFPRRLGVRFHPAYVNKKRVVGMQVKWDAFEDASFTKMLDPKLFHHEDIVSREGWARYYFDGKFTNNVSYVRLQLYDVTTRLLTGQFYFQFTKGFQRTLDGRFYVNDPILDERIVNGGVLEELRLREAPNGTQIYTKGKSTMKVLKVKDVMNPKGKKPVDVSIVRQTSVRYVEKPKSVYMVTPPHLMQYAKIILIMLKQLVELNFDQSYLTKEDQKPLYNTYFMLDEVGNLQCDGHGIDGLQTMLSIGLGQGQLFTLILQTLQQLREIYGDSVDKIVQGNVSNIIFLKSTDDTMIDTLVKMSGTTHRVYKDTKTATFDQEAVINQAEGKVSYTSTAKEEPVIKYNDFASLPERNSIVLRAGDPPIWNRNETILPMSWRLYKNTLVHPGREYTLQTIPTLSSAMDFDVRQNVPDFMSMLDKRKSQAREAKDAIQMYADAYEYDELTIQRMDPEVYADEVMAIINDLRLAQMTDDTKNRQQAEQESSMKLKKEAVDNPEVKEAITKAQTEFAKTSIKRYAGGTISRNDLINNGIHNEGLDEVIIEAYLECAQYFASDSRFVVNEAGELLDGKGNLLIRKQNESEELQAARNASMAPDMTAYGEDIPKTGTTYVVERAFREFLVSAGDWNGFAKGEFDKSVRVLMK